MFAWPFGRLLERGPQPVATNPFRWSVFAGRAIAAFAFVGLVPAEPAPAVRDVRAQFAPASQLAVVAVEEASRVQQQLEMPPQPARRIEPRVRAAAPRAPQPSAQEWAFEGALDLTVVHAGQFDLGAGPFGQSPLADPPLVDPHRQPRAQLTRR
jgi:hypothetical protein